VKTLYSERDYTYGATMLTLRTAIGLTQEGLADYLGVSRRAVGKWEAGSVYPRAEHLKKLIVLAVKNQAFAVGHEAEEIRTLWKAAHQKVLLDERWLSVVLDQQEAPHPYVEPPYEVTEFAIAGQAEADKLLSLQVPTVLNGGSESLENDESAKEEDGAETPKPSIPESLDKNDHAQESHDCSAQTPLQTIETRRDSGSSLSVSPCPATTVGAESEPHTVPTAPDETLAEKFLQRSEASDKTRRRRNLLIRTLIALVILTVISSAGTLFLYASNSARSTVQANKTPTAQAYPSYLSGHGTLAIFDPLNQEGDDWPTDKSDNTGGSCQFIAGAYHVSEQTAGDSYKCYPDATFSNFAFEVQLTITQGDCGGIVFRDKPSEGSYSFSICQHGMYRIRKYANLSDSTSMRHIHSSAIHAGLNQQNKIAVVASDNTMTFYVNEQQIDQIQDSSYTSGRIGFLAAPYHRQGHATDVAYTNARVWTL
jgi:transcriptional regulator with XRE-family HTH domain